MSQVSINKQNLIHKDVSKLTIAKIITAIISLVTSMLLSRYRTLFEYGTYSQMLIVINLFSSVFMLGLPNSLNYFIVRAKNDEERQKFVNCYYTLSTFLSLLLGLSLSLSINLLVSYFDNDYLKKFIYFLAIYPWTSITTGSIDHFLIASKKTNLLLVLKLIHNLLLFLLVLIFQLLRIPFEIYMICFVSLEVAVTIVDYFFVRRISGQLKPYISFSMIKMIFKFSIPIGIASIVGIASIELDKLIIDYFFTTEQLAIYSNCSKELPLAIFATSITAVGLPLLVRLLQNNEINEALQKWRSIFIVSFSVIAVFSFGLVFFAEDAVFLLYGDKYVPGSNVFRVYSIALLLKCVYFGMILNSIGKTKFILISSIVSLCLNVCLNFAFYYLWGFIGPAIATLVSSLVMNMFQLILTKRILKVKLKEVFPFQSLLTIILLNFLLGTFLLSLKSLIPLDTLIGQSFESVAFGVVWVAAYFAIIRKRIVHLYKTI